MIKVKRAHFGHHISFRNIVMNYIDCEAHHCELYHDGTMLYIHDEKDCTDVPLTNIAYIKRVERGLPVIQSDESGSDKSAASKASPKKSA